MTTVTYPNRAAGLGVRSVESIIGNGEAFSEALRPEPAAISNEVVGFDRVARLGRKGTSTFDRVTSLALATCGDALATASLEDIEGNADRFGVVAATTNASLKSVSDFSRATFEEDRPYLVNPMLFPNTVMNCAAGQAAIRFQLRGPNATVAGADLAGIQMLHYTLGLARRGYLDRALVFGAEELTPEYTALHAHSRAKLARLSEGAASAVLTNDLAAASVHLASAAVVTHMATRGEAIGAAVQRCLRRVGITPERPADLVLLVTPLEVQALEAAKPLAKDLIDTIAWSGFLRSAQAVVGMGIAVEALTASADVRRVVLLGQGNEGQFGAAVLESAQT